MIIFNQQQKITEIRSRYKDTETTKLENEIFQICVGKIMWLAENCCPHMSIIALKLAQRATKATLGDLGNMNKAIKKMVLKKNDVIFQDYLGEWNRLCFI